MPNPRQAGLVLQTIAQTIRDLRILPRLDPERHMGFLLERQEDRKSNALARILEAGHNPRQTMSVFFFNIINALLTLKGALPKMVPQVTDGHIKDVKIGPDRGGFAHHP